MPMLRNKIQLLLSKKHSPLVGAFLFLLLVVAGAKMDIDLGGKVSFTLQTLFLSLAYFYLPIKWRLAVIVIYLVLGVSGVPVFNGEPSWSYFTSWPLGFFIGFVVSAAIPSPSYTTFISVFGYFLFIHGIILALGVTWMFYFGGSFSPPWDVVLDLLPGAAIKSACGTGVVFGINLSSIIISDSERL